VNPAYDDQPEPAAEELPADAIGHFWKAAHELLAAARLVIDAADAVVEEQMHTKSGPPATTSRVRRIDVDGS
jgi:hypothetical protein